MYKELLPGLGGYLTHAGALDRSRLEVLLGRLAALELSTLQDRAEVGTAPVRTARRQHHTSAGRWCLWRQRQRATPSMRSALACCALAASRQLSGAAAGCGTALQMRSASCALPPPNACHRALGAAAR